MTISTDIPVPPVALAIGAHPDDIEFNCGATLAKWAHTGCEVHLLILTDGSKGSWDPGTDRAALAEQRRTETRCAAAALGAEPVHVTFLGNVDGELVCGPQQTAEVCAVIRTVKPDAILGHDPWKRYRLHPDHRAAGFLTVDGIVAAREPHYTTGQKLPPHRPAALLLFEADAVDHVEAAAGFAPHKVEALLAHASQHVSTMGIRSPADVPRFREWVTADLAEKGSLADLAAGEAFKLLTEL